MAKAKVIKKIVDETLGKMSRRRFLKGMGATAAATAVPKSILKGASSLAQASKLSLPNAVPWVKSMTNTLKSFVDASGPLALKSTNLKSKELINLKKLNKKLPNGTTIHYLEPPKYDWDSHKLVIKTADGKEDAINFKEYKDDITIEFDIRDDYANNQWLTVDKKTGHTEMMDDNFTMAAGGEDIIKDDPIVWAIEKDTHKWSDLGDTFESKDHLNDFYSVPDDSDYQYLFERYVDSFSPAGNIFKTKQYAKAERAKRLKEMKLENERKEMDWEEQFRGGQGIHGYRRGGLPRRREKLQPRSRQAINQSIRTHGMNTDRLLDAVKMVESGGENRPNYAFSPKGAMGAYQILPTTAMDPGLYHHGATKWPTFEQEFRASPQNPNFESKSRNWAGSYLNALNKHFDNDWKKAISAYFWGMGNVGEGDYDENYYNKVMGFYNKGGIARRPNAVPPTQGPDPYGKLIDDSVTQIMNNPSEYMGTEFMQKFSKGGFVKKMAPKVLGRLTTYKPKITMSDILKNIQKAKKPTVTDPYTIYDKALTPLKKFKTRDEAQTWLNRNYTADSNIHPEVVYKAKTTLKSMEPKAEDPGAMFWGSREKIIGAPSEAMTGTQWLQYLQLGKHGILNPKGYPIIKHAELNDTSLAPWLSRMGNNTVSKEALVKQFDEMAPTMDVTVLGESTGERIFSDMSKKLNKMDTQAIRDPAIKGFYDYMKAVLPQLKETPTGKEADNIAKHINEMVERNFGVRNALDEGLPQRFPFEMKETLQQISTGLGKRTAGFKTYKRNPQHRGTQMMSGGDNYREFLFKYKPGSLRQNEPEYKYAHDFNLESSERMGGIVHSRTSDRSDQFGRRLLHIEEIQSDMHQLVNAAQRALKKKHADWAKAGKTPEGEYAKMSERGKEDYDKLVADGKYATRGDLKEEIGTANEQHLLLLTTKIEDLLAQKQTPAIKTRLNRLNKERIKVRKIINDEKKKMEEGDHSGVPQGPLSKTEDYNEFIMKYMLKVAREGGYDGITINTPAIKNLNMSPTGKDYKGNVVAYGPMAQGAMKKAAKKSGAKFMKTYIVDDDNRAWEVPMILIKENKATQAIIDKGLPIYKRGGVVKK